MTDVQRWLGLQLDNGYTYFQVVVEDGTSLAGDGTPLIICMYPELIIPLHMYKAATLAINYMNLYNHALASNYTSCM